MRTGSQDALSQQLSPSHSERRAAVRRCGATRADAICATLAMLVAGLAFAAPTLGRSQSPTLTHEFVAVGIRAAGGAAGRAALRPALRTSASGTPVPRAAAAAQAKSNVDQGKMIYEDNCTRCHVDGDAPSLTGLYKKPKMQNGAAPTDENVREKILHGGDIMPPYEDRLKKDEVDALIAYLHTL
jgi:mono/diheme cytochrome c family protein